MKFAASPIAVVCCDPYQVASCRSGVGGISRCTDGIPIRLQWQVSGNLGDFM